MKVTGIIAEYNPFHEGHKYQLTQSQKITDSDFTIVVMSGSFVQRGGCSITDTYTRAKCALLSGADLVLQLPVVFSTGSAELFARGSIRLLQQLGVVTHLSFGCETTNLSFLQKCGQILATEPSDYQEFLKSALSRGYSYPKARQMALSKFFPEDVSLLQQPNTILGLEYCKALYLENSTIQPVIIPRKGAGFHDIDIQQDICSATGIREFLREDGELKKLNNAFPSYVLKELEAASGKTFPLFDDDFSQFLHFALLKVADHDYTVFQDVSTELSNRIRQNLFRYQSFHQFAQVLKSKELTYTRICRCLIHILLDIKKSTVQEILSLKKIPYIRIIGMKKSAAALLSLIKEKQSAPFITNSKKSFEQFTGISKTMLDLDLFATQLWNHGAAARFQTPAICEQQNHFLKTDDLNF